MVPACVNPDGACIVKLLHSCTYTLLGLQQSRINQSSWMHSWWGKVRQPFTFSHKPNVLTVPRCFWVPAWSLKSVAGTCYYDLSMMLGLCGYLYKSGTAHAKMLQNSAVPLCMLAGRGPQAERYSRIRHASQLPF